MTQYVTFRHIEKYPKLYAEAMDFVKEIHIDSDLTDKDIATGMRGWGLHPFGREFWYLISCGRYDDAIESYPHLAYLLEEDQSDKPLVIKNNGLWM